jgi:hypothetical protein
MTGRGNSGPADDRTNHPGFREAFINLPLKVIQSPFFVFPNAGKLQHGNHLKQIGVHTIQHPVALDKFSLGNKCSVAYQGLKF